LDENVRGAAEHRIRRGFNRHSGAVIALFHSFPTRSGHDHSLTYGLN
jgi:hypothetical protein